MRSECQESQAPDPLMNLDDTSAAMPRATLHLMINGGIASTLHGMTKQTNHHDHADKAQAPRESCPIGLHGDLL